MTSEVHRRDGAEQGALEELQNNGQEAKTTAMVNHQFQRVLPDDPSPRCRCYCPKSLQTFLHELEQCKKVVPLLFMVPWSQIYHQSLKVPKTEVSPTTEDEMPGHNPNKTRLSPGALTQCTLIYLVEIKVYLYIFMNMFVIVILILVRSCTINVSISVFNNERRNNSISIRKINQNRRLQK